MFNYADLSDFEFEYLAQDIMEKKLGVKLHIFGKGRDTGIDLTDDAKNTEVIIQVKHYYKSTAANLINELRKEVDKVNLHKPKKYFVICSTTLLPQHVKTIFELFQNFMESTHNILSIQDIDEFLQQEENVQIVKKNFKLWLHADIFLSEMSSRNVFFDSQVLLTQIKDRQKLFVQTEAYNVGLKYLNEHRALFIVGMPGTGKTIMSQMYVLFFASKGYTVKYSTDGEDIKALKNAISGNPDLKEVILIDDCLGQRYFKMHDTQGSQVLSLIRYVRANPNKILISNSRITIFNEANKRGREMFIALERKELKVYILNADMLNEIEKAKILYNHLYFSEIPEQHFKYIRQEKRYFLILRHKNYVPRLCEYIVLPSFYEGTSPEEYFLKVIGIFDNPEAIWETEFDERIQATDRILLTTLFSLTDNLVDYEILEQCFNYRIRNNANVDKTINNFELSLQRLNGSMLRIASNRGVRQVGVMNPSVNDFLKSKIDRNFGDKQDIIANIITIDQAIRILGHTADTFLLDKVTDGSIRAFKLDTTKERADLIIYNICLHNILKEEYRKIIETYILKPRSISVKNHYKLSRSIVFKKLLENPLADFYNIIDLFNNEVIENAFSFLELDDAVEIAGILYNAFEKKLTIEALELVSDKIAEGIKEVIEEYYSSVSVSDEAEAFDVQDIISDNAEYGEDGLEVDIDEAASELESVIKDELYDRVYDLLRKLPSKVNKKVNFDGDFELEFGEAQRVIEGYLEPDVDDYDDNRRHHDFSAKENEVDRIFKA